MKRHPTDVAVGLVVYLAVLVGTFACGWYVHTQATALPLID